MKLFLHYGDLCDATNLITIISKVKPTEIYNLGAMSHVKASTLKANHVSPLVILAKDLTLCFSIRQVSFDMPEYTADCDGVGVLRILDAIRASGLEKSVRFYQASTSELYGKVQEVPQSETTPFYPRSPYAGAWKTHETTNQNSGRKCPTNPFIISRSCSQWPSSTPFGFLSTTVKPTECT